MVNRRKRSAAPPARASRSDGARTRAHILEVAGQLYAEKGFVRTTSKEICARADVGMAAVNYHFGSREGLYEAALIEAHRQIVSLDELETIAAGEGSAMHKLSRVVAHFAARAVAQQQWGLRVLARELMSPSPQAPALIRQAVLPKSRIIVGLVARVLGLPPAHPAVQRALAFVILPCVMLVVVPRALRAQVAPALDADPQALADDLARYVRAGMDALRRAHAVAPAKPARRPRRG